MGQALNGINELRGLSVLQGKGYCIDGQVGRYMMLTVMVIDDDDDDDDADDDVHRSRLTLDL